MEPFRSVLPKQHFPFTIGLEDQILSLGSCFAEHIGQRLIKYKFRCLLNPFGILYNPISIAQSLRYLLEERSFTKDDLFFDGHLWHSFDHHGRFSATSAEECLVKINQSLEQARTHLSNSNRLIITLGTAFVWWHKSQERIVANCHKVPSADFDRQMLQPANMVQELAEILQKLKEVNPNLECIISVSPVRHLRDGLVNNQKSKAALVLAAHDLTEKLKYVHYFPAYEIFMDDLRDYRFYKADLIHPSEVGIDYVWEYFQNSLFSLSTQTSVKTIKKILQAREHRPLFPDSDAHHQFIRSTITKMEQLEQSISELSFAEEKTALREQLTKF